MGSQLSKWGQWFVTNTGDGYQQLSYYTVSEDQLRKRIPADDGHCPIVLTSSSLADSERKLHKVLYTIKKTVQNHVSILGFPLHTWFSHRFRFSLAIQGHMTPYKALIVL